MQTLELKDAVSIGGAETISRSLREGKLQTYEKVAHTVISAYEKRVYRYVRAATIMLLLMGCKTVAQKPVSLREAIESAVRQNLNIAVTSYEPLISQAAVAAAKGRFDPALESAFYHNENVQRIPFSQVGLYEESQSGVRGLLPWGMDYQFGFTSRSIRGTTSDPLSRYQSGLQFGLAQPLLRDFGTAQVPLRIARTNTRISEWELRQEVVDTVTRVHFVFNTLYFSREDLEVAKRSRSLAQTLMEDNIRRTNIGVMSPLDITTARAEVAARQEAVILAERAVRDNENYLKQLMTDDTDELLDKRLQIVPPPMAAYASIDVRAAIRDALAQRPDFRQRLLDIEKRNITLAFERNQSLPRLDVRATLSLLGLDSDFSGSFNNAAQQDQSSWSAGAVFSLPIPNRTARGRADIARLQAAQAVMDLKRLEQEIIVRVDNTAGQIVTTRQRIESTKESVRLARESLAAGQERLSAGISTTFEVLELQKKLAEVEVAELRARADYNKAVAELDRQTGTTLERNAIRFESGMKIPAHGH